MTKKDGLLKRLKNFEGKNEEKNQLKTIKSQAEKQLKEIIDKTSNKIGLIKNTPFLKKSTFEGSTFLADTDDYTCYFKKLILAVFC